MDAFSVVVESCTLQIFKGSFNFKQLLYICIDLLVLSIQFQNDDSPQSRRLQRSFQLTYYTLNLCNSILGQSASIILLNIFSFHAKQEPGELKLILNISRIMLNHIFQNILDGYFLIKHFEDPGHFDNIVIVVFMQMRHDCILRQLLYPHFQFVLHIVQLIVVFEGMQGYSSNHLLQIAVLQRLYPFSHILQFYLNVLVFAQLS